MYMIYSEIQRVTRFILSKMKEDFVGHSLSQVHLVFKWYLVFIFSGTTGVMKFLKYWPIWFIKSFSF